MKRKLFLSTLLLTLVFLGCSKEKTVTKNCLTPNLGITQLNGSNYTHDNGNLGPEWEVRYSEEFVEIFAIRYFGNHPNERSIYAYVFKKTNNCLEFYYAYSAYEGWLKNRQRILPIVIDNVLIQDWEEDSLFSGKIVKTNSSGDIIQKNFWVNLTPNNIYNFGDNTLTTENCIDTITPTEIDMNNDGIIDVTFQKQSIDYTPNSAWYTPIMKNSNIIKLLPENNNSFLNGDFGLFSEAPFTSANRSEFQGHIKDILGHLHEFEPPYNRLNFWYADSYSQGLTYYLPNYFPDLYLNNDIDDYLIVKIEKDGLFYYGWIKMKIDFDNCQFEVLETYLNPTPNEHVSVP